MRWSGFRAAVVMLAITMMAACTDGIAPGVHGATILISLEGVSYEEQTVAVDSVFQLTAEVLDGGGRIVHGEKIEWRSDRPEVVRVDRNGVVHARTVGTANIIARHEVGEDTARINVAIPIAAQQMPDCVGEPDLVMDVGDVRTFPGNEALPLCLPGRDAGAEYTIIAINTGLAATSSIELQILANGLAADGGAQANQSIQSRAGMVAADTRFHRHLQEEVAERLEPRLRAGTDPSEFAARSNPKVGTTLSFNVETESSNGCTNPVLRGGRIQVVSERAVIVADTLNPVGGFTDEDYARIAEFFDRDAWPLMTERFGEPSDVDKNGRVFLFFTHAVNQLPGNSPESSGSYVGGYFFNRDLFSTLSCFGSNAAEVIYMLVPDPSPAPGYRAFAKSFVERSTRAVLVHEFQHLINASRRLHINRAPVWEESWLNEGLSHIAEELMFYRLSGTAPGSNLGSDDFRDDAAREAYRLFQLDNLERYRVFLRNPDHATPLGSDEIPNRGAAWSFLRYAADRRGGEEADFWRALAGNSRTAGMENLRQALGAEPAEWLRDWATTLYLDDTRSAIDRRYQITSWDFRDLYASASTLWPGVPDDGYPLNVRRLREGVRAALPLQGGGAGYVRAGVAANGRAVIRVFSGPQPLLPAPTRVQIVVVRTA